MIIKNEPGWQIGGRTLTSRLIVGTGKYKSGQETARAIAASGAEMVTVAVRRVNLDRSKESLLDFIDPKQYFLLPNTAGCYTADGAAAHVKAAPSTRPHQRPEKGVRNNRNRHKCHPPDQRDPLMCHESPRPRYTALSSRVSRLISLGLRRR